jgi:hypothetical protein
MKVWMVAWSGGYETPSFEFFTDHAKAQASFDEHKSDFRSGEGDDLSLVLYDTDTDKAVHVDSYVDGVDNVEEAL